MKSQYHGGDLVWIAERERRYTVTMKKAYIVTKFIVAESLEEALKKERHTKPDEVMLTEASRNHHCDELSPGKSKKG